MWQNIVSKKKPTERVQFSAGKESILKGINSMFNFNVFKCDVKYVIRRLLVGLPLSYLILKFLGVVMLFLGALVGEL